MTYNEIKTNYKWIVKKAPDVTNFSDIDGKIITMTETRYTKRGGRWIETEARTEKIPVEFYLNTVDAVPFFKGLGGREKLVLTYTTYGYIPVEIQSISPAGENKTVRRFSF